MSTQVYTYEDIKSKTEDHDCWVVIFGNVYNISRFLVEHPGGVEVILELAGKDVTGEFVAQRHTRYARSLLSHHIVGKYDYSKDPEEYGKRPLVGYQNKSKRVITHEELQKHQTSQDCWLVIDNKVYDVTPWLQDHPGGQKLLIDLAGKDATKEYQGHPVRVGRILEALFIGEYISNVTEKSTIKLYDENELSRHSTEDDCWIVIDKKVYDVTKFLDQHPGGTEIIVNNSGNQDATTLFENQAHSQYAKQLMNNYYIGELQGKHTLKAANKYNSFSIKEILFILAGLLVAFGLYHLIK